MRERRREIRALSQPLRPAVAVVTDGRSCGSGDLLRTVGADIPGLLGPDPLESLAWAAREGVPSAYIDLRALFADDVEAVWIDIADPAWGPVALAAARAGVHVLLAAPPDEPAEAAATARELADAADEGDVAASVVLRTRAWPGAAVLKECVGDSPPVQVTLLGWPANQYCRVELVDVVSRCCGDIVAVCADAGAMPAPRLTPDAPVTISLLTERGTTVLVAERPDASMSTCLITVTGQGQRIVLAGSRLLRQDDRGVLPVPVAEHPAGAPDGPDALASAARGVVHLVATPDALPEAATARDLLVACRALEAAAESEASGGWVEI